MICSYEEKSLGHYICVGCQQPPEMLQYKVPYLHEPSSPSLSSTNSLVKLLNFCALPHETLINQFAKTFNT